MHIPCNIDHYSKDTFMCIQRVPLLVGQSKAKGKVYCIMQDKCKCLGNLQCAGEIINVNEHARYVRRGKYLVGV